MRGPLVHTLVWYSQYYSDSEEPNWILVHINQQHLKYISCIFIYINTYICTHTLSQGKFLHKQGGFNIIEDIWKINIFQLDGQRVKRTGKWPGSFLFVFIAAWWMNLWFSHNPTSPKGVRKSPYIKTPNSTPTYQQQSLKYLDNT